jgi:hypothetical protein
MIGDAVELDKSVTSDMPPNSVVARLSQSQNCAWVGALSAEDRCTGSIRSLARQKARIVSAYVLDYEAELEHASLATQSPNGQWEILRSIERDSLIREIKRQPLSPYAFHDLQAFLENVLFKSGADFALFDVTCFTKIHLLALAATLSQRPQVPPWAVVYAKPENYVATEHNPGWRDIIVAPLGDTGFLLNETFSRGVIIPGHEGDRLTVALAEMEASGGVILVADTTGRPDLRYLTQKRNQRTFHWLVRPNTVAWVKRVVKEDAVTSVSEYVSRETNIAKTHNAPVLLFPYGPKSLVFLVARRLSLEYPDWSWFVYPIPYGRATEFSEGIERLIWIMPFDDSNPRDL